MPTAATQPHRDNAMNQPTPLRHLIAEAVSLGGGNLCAAGHDWVADGGRRCPRGADTSSQTVYRCERCGEYDYGGAGGPGAADCASPCTHDCSI